jgi:O-acetyl-ADP-ribose deacetylase (regulator of RNase III)
MLINRTTLELVGGDITTMDTEAIVNAANAQLQLGAGVAGAIRRRGGPSIQAECDRIGGTHVGGAVVTGAGDLPASYVIHAVGPRMGEGDEENKLVSAVKESLRRCEENSIKSVAFPAISTGIFGFPLDRAARLMLAATIEHLRGETYLTRVVFCLFGEESLAEFERALAELTG